MIAHTSSKSSISHVSRFYHLFDCILDIIDHHELA